MRTSRSGCDGEEETEEKSEEKAVEKTESSSLFRPVFFKRAGQLEPRLDS